MTGSRRLRRRVRNIHGDLFGGVRLTPRGNVIAPINLRIMGRRNNAGKSLRTYGTRSGILNVWWRAVWRIQSTPLATSTASATLRASAPMIIAFILSTSFSAFFGKPVALFGCSTRRRSKGHRHNRQPEMIPEARRRCQLASMIENRKACIKEVTAIRNVGNAASGKAA